MASHPVLVFPTHGIAPRLMKSGGGANFHKPSPAQQRDRVEPQLLALANVVERRSGELRATAAGLAPEQVLVLEIISTVEDFVNAVRRVEGMEWLADWAADDVMPDEFFFDLKNEDKLLPRRLFFITANQNAMDQLLSLWQRWLAGAKLPHGFGKWKDIFRQLRSIRRWGVRDRILETGIIEDWRYQIAQGSGTVRAEIEFWFRNDRQMREQIEGEAENRIAAAHGQILSRSSLPAIGYHALLVELPVASVQRFTDAELPVQSMGVATDWLFFDQVEHVRPTGQMAVRLAPDYITDAAIVAESPLESELPLGALFDGMPLTQHAVLRDRLLVDDPLDWGDTYPSTRRQHGTAMASNIVRGDLNDATAPALKSPLYVRPVMRPRDDGMERVPPDVLLTDFLYAAVRRLFQGEGMEPAVAPSVREINLSICDPNRPFFAIMSSLARLLDWLAFEYGVLFVVSAGNHGEPLTLDVPRGTLLTMTAGDLQNAAIRAVLRDARNRRLLSPAESINSLTVGASHSDKAVGRLPDGVVDPIESGGCASPINALGYGFRRSIKPEVLAAGGRQPYRARLGTTHASEILERTWSPRPFGVKVAVPGGEGDVSARGQVCGTSNAAADVSRNAIRIIEVLDELTSDSGMSLVPDPYRALAAKCLIAHGCDWGEGQRQVEAAAAGTEGDLRAVVARLLGYGCTAGVEVTVCSDARVTVLGTATLMDGKSHVYDLPLPPELSGRVLRRRLTVSLAWNSPINVKHQKYRCAALWFTVDADRLAVRRRNADWQAVQRGTIQHEIFEGVDAVVIGDDDRLRVTVNCRADAGRLLEQIPYVLAVTLKVDEDAGIQMYDHVRARLEVPVPLRV